jgi:hypothetical protein
MQGMAGRLKPRHYWSPDLSMDEGGLFSSQLSVRGARSYFDILQKSGSAAPPAPRKGLWESVASFFSRHSFGRGG